MKGILLDVILPIVDIFFLTIASVVSPNIREERHNEYKSEAQQQFFKCHNTYAKETN